MRLVINLSRRLQKHQPLKILTSVYFLRIFEISHFWRFSKFHVACAKFVVCIFLSEQDSPNIIELGRPICDDKNFTAAAHFRFEF